MSNTPRDQSSSTLSPEQFDPLAALEDLRARLARLEALSHCAVQGTEALPRPAEKGDRRASRLVSLVFAIRAEATTALDEADHAIERVHQDLEGVRSDVARLTDEPEGR